MLKQKCCEIPTMQSTVYCTPKSVDKKKGQFNFWRKKCDTC